MWLYGACRQEKSTASFIYLFFKHFVGISPEWLVLEILCQLSGTQFLLRLGQNAARDDLGRTLSDICFPGCSRLTLKTAKQWQSTKHGHCSPLGFMDKLRSLFFLHSLRIWTNWIYLVSEQCSICTCIFQPVCGCWNNIRSKLKDGLILTVCDLKLAVIQSFKS